MTSPTTKTLHLFVMINARIDIDTSSSPYKVQRRAWDGQPPALLRQYLNDKNDWMIFCDRIDLLLDSRGGLEEIKAVWMILGVITTVLLLGIIAGIICTIVLIDRQEDGGTLSIILGCLLAGLFLVFAIYFYLMKRLVVDQLRAFALKIDTYCAEIAEKKSNNAVTFRFAMNVNKCKLYWDRDFQCWIDVSTSDPIDLGPSPISDVAQDGHIEMSGQR